MSERVIPVEAVEAAAKAMFLMDRKEGWIAALPHETKRYYDLAVTALEAAAPHMRQAFMLEMNLAAVQDELNTPLQFRKASHGDD